MSFHDEKDSAALDHIEKAIADSHELEPIVKLFQKYSILEDIRKRELAADQEDCYGPWLGGKYYHVALDRALAEWSSNKKSETQEYTQSLQLKLAEATTENAHLRREIKNIEDFLIRIVTQIGNRPNSLSEGVTIQIESWILARAKQIEEAKAKAEADAKFVSDISP